MVAVVDDWDDRTSFNYMTELFVFLSYFFTVFDHICFSSPVALFSVQKRVLFLVLKLAGGNITHWIDGWAFGHDA